MATQQPASNLLVETEIKNLTAEEINLVRVIFVEKFDGLKVPLKYFTRIKLKEITEFEYNM